MEHLVVLEDIGHKLRTNQVKLLKCDKQRLTKGYIESKIECIDDYWNDFTRAYTAFISKIPGETHSTIPYLSNNEYHVIEDIYLCMKADLKDILSRLVTSERCLTSDTRQQIQVHAKLPRIELPTFTGKYEDWSSFNDLFTSLVHNEQSLSKVQKLYYLKSCLKDDAEGLIKHIKVTENNYEHAWGILKKRYGNKRLIVHELLNRLFNQKRCTARTATQIKLLLDTTEQCLNSLKYEGLVVTSWDPIIIHYVVQKLDIEIHKQWEEYAYNLNANESPNWSDLKQFLERTFRTLELVDNASYRSSTKEEIDIIKESTVYLASTPLSHNCTKCQANHTLSHCKRFSKLDTQDRREFVKRKNLCFNCLMTGHSAFKCRVSTSCHRCKGRHHSLLHEKRDKLTSKEQEQHGQIKKIEDKKKEEDETSYKIATHAATKKSTALLATALVPVRDDKGFKRTLRVLVDTGSQANLISERAAHMLKVKKIYAKGIITGVGLMRTTSNHVVNIELLSRYENDFKLNIKAHIMTTRLTTYLPSRTIHLPLHTWKNLKQLSLADPTFYKRGRIDMIIGAEVYSQILKSGSMKGPPGFICTQNTNLGWILFGIAQNTSEIEKVFTMQHNMNQGKILNNQWKVKYDRRKCEYERKRNRHLIETKHTTNYRNLNCSYIKLPKKTCKKQIVRRNFECNKEECTAGRKEYKTSKHLEEVLHHQKGFTKKEKGIKTHTQCYPNLCIALMPKVT